MLETFKDLLTHQFEAALCTLNAGIDRCGESAWNEPVGGLAFCQVAFHTLFYTDYYLGPNDDAFRTQPFHREHAGSFRDYEEFQDRPQSLMYERAFVKRYLQHCRDKAAVSIAAETAEKLRGGSGFARREFTRAELHVYNIRHIQHHAAQLSLRLRIDTGDGIPWVGCGWREI